jgi:hypothetical protein
LPHIHLQPKQGELLDLIERSPASVIGVGGGRGAAKSGGADRIALILMMEQPGMVGCIIMRNADQVRKYHIEPIKRDFPELADYIHGTDKKLSIPAGKTVSELDFSYAESLADVERRFRSANYRYIIIDQAEQFTWKEIGEILLANRSKGNIPAKALLLFNMGGTCIGDLRNRFGPKKKFNEGEDPSQYVFLHVYPWDNVEWSRAELERDGLTEDDYYAWTDAERKQYFVTRSPYGRKLNSLDPAIKARDLDGSWEAVEGAYFWRSFDHDKTMISAELAESLIRPWDSRWLSTDWGKTHFCSTHWHGQTKLSPVEIKNFLGWEVSKPLNVVVTYRRMIVSGLTSPIVGNKVVQATPVKEREQIKRYFFSPEQFGERDSENTVPINIGAELRPYGMPEPEMADNSRKPGWELMDQLLTSTRIWATPPQERDPEEQPGDTVWLISSECPELLDTIPLLMRNQKDLDDVVKTDMSQTDLKMDVADDVRYGLLSMLRPGIKPDKIKHAEKLISMHSKTGYSQELTMTEIAFRASQNGPEFSVSGRRRR